MKKWILLVEDSDDDVVLTRIALEQNNIANELVVARDGAEAMEELSEKKIALHGELPTVVLLSTCRRSTEWRSSSSFATTGARSAFPS
jgi:hypothetical protein